MLLTLFAVLQLPPERPTGSAQPVPGEYSTVASVRELSDGRLLVLDSREQRLHLVDRRRGSSRSIGAQGAGPGEFRRGTTLLAARGDTTWLVDAGNGRLLVIAPDGSFPGVVTQGADRQMNLGLAQASDRMGNIYGTGPLTAPDPNAPPTAVPDSQAVLRFAVATAQATRLAVLAAPPARITVRRSGEKIESVEIRRPPFSVGDQFAVSPTGRIAIARRDPYRVDQLLPSGAMVRGASVAVPPVPVRDAERDAFLDDLPAPSRANAAATLEWPEVLPAFPARELFALANGETWVRRHAPATSPTIWYDLFDARGQRIARLVLPRDRRIIAVGPRGTWVVRTDEDGLQHLELYPALRDTR